MIRWEEIPIDADSTLLVPSGIDADEMFMRLNQVYFDTLGEGMRRTFSVPMPGACGEDVDGV